MSVYANDPRVEAIKFHVRSDQGHALVWLRGDGRWVSSSSDCADVDHPTQDEAIRSLIGEPKS